MTVIEGTPVAAAAPRRRRPWYRRRGLLAGSVVAAIAAVTVVTDLPRHASRPVEVAGEASTVSRVNADVAACSYGLGESLTIWADVQARSLTPAQTRQVPGLLRDDQQACSFVDDSIYQLSTLEVPASAPGRHLSRMIGAVTMWASSDALGAIEAIQTLATSPGDAAALRSLTRYEGLLRADRAKAEAELAAAGTLLSARLPALRLARLPASGG